MALSGQAPETTVDSDEVRRSALAVAGVTLAVLVSSSSLWLLFSGRGLDRWQVLTLWALPHVALLAAVIWRARTPARGLGAGAVVLVLFARGYLPDVLPQTLLAPATEAFVVVIAWGIARREGWQGTAIGALTAGAGTLLATVLMGSAGLWQAVLVLVPLSILLPLLGGWLAWQLERIGAS